jgi:hypothetical protein
MWKAFLTIQVNQATGHRELTDLISNLHQFDLDLKDSRLWKSSCRQIHRQMSF